MTCGSLFSGIGGFDLGFEQAGIKCEWQVEKDKTCRKVLTRHWPNVEKFKDVKDVGKNNLSRVDVLCGGFPCTDVSIAGRRAGLAGKQSGLWYEFHRILFETRPRIVVIENVPGLLSSNSGKDFAVILRGLVECGYGVSWRILDAQYFGLAQRRRRVFIVGNLGNGSSARVLFESEGVSWDSPTRSKTGQGIAETFAASLRSGGNGKRGYTYDAEHGLTTVAFSAGNSGDSYGIGLSEELSPPLRAGSSGTNQTPTIARSVTASNGHHGHSSPRGDGSDNLVIAKSPMSHSGRINIEEETFIAATLNSGGNDGGFRSEPGEHIVLNPAVGVRRLTPRECERLQGFPDDFTALDADGKKISNSARYKMLGNAIAVPCAKWIAERIILATQNE